MNRTPTNYAVTREQRRFIAKKNMKDAGLKQICKPVYFNENGTRHSFFAKQWKNYSEEFKHGN